MVHFLQSKPPRKDVQAVHTLKGTSIHLTYPRENNNRNRSIRDLNVTGRVLYSPSFYLLSELMYWHNACHQDEGTAAVAFNGQKNPRLTSESTELKTAAMHQYQGDCVNTN